MMIGGAWCLDHRGPRWTMAGDARVETFSMRKKMPLSQTEDKKKITCCMNPF